MNDETGVCCGTVVPSTKKEKRPWGSPIGFTKNKHTFYSWQDMRRRCQDPRRRDFQHYGGRGITVCQRWDESFHAFITDMGKKPDGHSLERVNVNLPYCPENCIWLPKSRQMCNTRRTIYLEVNGHKMCAKDACRKYGVNYVSWKQRRKRLNESPQVCFDHFFSRSAATPIP